MAAGNDITLVRDAIHNPADPRHFMRLTRPNYRVTATIAGIEIATSTRAIKLKEVRRDIYDPVIYFPREDVDMGRLVTIAKSTYCPLKGDTEYFDAHLGTQRFAEVAWSYTRALRIAHVIQNCVAFDARRVHVVEHSADSDGQ